MEARTTEESILPASPREIERALSFTIGRHLPDRLIRLHKPLFYKSIPTKHRISYTNEIVSGSGAGEK